MPKPLTSIQIQTRINAVAADLAKGDITRPQAVKKLNGIVASIREADNAGLLFESFGRTPRLQETTR